MWVWALGGGATASGIENEKMISTQEKNTVPPYSRSDSNVAQEGGDEGEEEGKEEGRGGRKRRKEGIE